MRIIGVPAYILLLWHFLELGNGMHLNTFTTTQVATSGGHWSYRGVHVASIGFFFRLPPTNIGKVKKKSEMSDDRLKDCHIISIAILKFLSGRKKRLPLTF